VREPAFSGELASQLAPYTRGFLGFGRREPIIGHSVADGELLSASNSLIIRENIGNFSDSGRLPGRLCGKTPCLREVFFGIPYSTDQGILICEQGILSADQGIFKAEQRNSPK
jgi:hypothetical protein